MATARKAPPSLMVSVTVAAQMLGIGRSTVYDMIARGDWPQSVTLRRVGTRLMVNRDQLEAWCRGDEQAAAS